MIKQKRSAKNAHSRVRNDVAKATALGAKISQARIFLLIKQVLSILLTFFVRNMIEYRRFGVFARKNTNQMFDNFSNKREFY